MIPEFPLEMIQQKLLAMAMDMMSGKQPEMVSVNVDMKVPKPIKEIVDSVAMVSGISPAEIVSQMASDGLQKSLNQMVAQLTGQQTAVKPKPPMSNPLEALSQLQALASSGAASSGDLDIAKVSKSLESIKGLAAQLQELEAGLKNGT